VILEIWRSIPKLEKIVIFRLEKHVSPGKSPFYVQKKEISEISLILNG
jgi:hypothetical protein